MTKEEDAEVARKLREGDRRLREAIDKNARDQGVHPDQHKK